MASTSTTARRRRQGPTRFVAAGHLLPVVRGGPASPAGLGAGSARSAVLLARAGFTDSTIAERLEVAGLGVSIGAFSSFVEATQEAAGYGGISPGSRRIEALSKSALAIAAAGSRRGGTAARLDTSERFLHELRQGPPAGDGPPAWIPENSLTRAMLVVPTAAAGLATMLAALGSFPAAEVWALCGLVLVGVPLRSFNTHAARVRTRRTRGGLEFTLADVAAAFWEFVVAAGGRDWPAAVADRAEQIGGKGRV